MWIAICAGWILASILFYTCLIYFSMEIAPEDSLEESAGDYIENSLSESPTNITIRAA